MKKPTPDKLKIGDAELALLRRFAEDGAMTVREAAERLSTDRELGRTTVGKMIDRLVAKGLLSREESEGHFRYRSTLTLAELNQKLLSQFVETALGGSLQPFVAYLHGSAALTAEEMNRLEDMIRRFEEEPK